MMFPMLNALLCLFITISHADFTIAPNLSELQRKLLLKTLGLGTLSKNLTSPKTLGSDSGIEIALSTEIINTSEIEEIITNSQARNTLLYPKILIGKGLYDSADLYFHFIPYTATLGISEFGGMLRVGVYQSENNPFVMSWNIHANSSNFNNQLTSQNVGTDLSFGFDWGAFAIFASGGWATSSGKFVGGTDGITDTGFSETERVQSQRISLGMLYKYDIYDVAISLDHYVEPVYSVKFGVLF